jgi:hypothetical protein
MTSLITSSAPWRCGRYWASGSPSILCCRRWCASSQHHPPNDEDIWLPGLSGCGACHQDKHQQHGTVGHHRRVPQTHGAYKAAQVESHATNQDRVDAIPFKSVQGIEEALAVYAEHHQEGHTCKRFFAVNIRPAVEKTQPKNFTGHARDEATGQKGAERARGIHSSTTRSLWCAPAGTATTGACTPQVRRFCWWSAGG